VKLFVQLGMQVVVNGFGERLPVIKGGDRLVRLIKGDRAISFNLEAGKIQFFFNRARVGSGQLGTKRLNRFGGELRLGRFFRRRRW
jgi:hypothetical protein